MTKEQTVEEFSYETATDIQQRALYVAWQEHVGVPIQEGNGLDVAQEILENVCRVVWRGKR